MGMFEHFPFTNFHELNLDWILGKIKEFNTKIDSFEHSAMPTGGTAGQVLAKASNEDYDSTWATIPAGPQGPQGPRGPQGPEGPTGPAGADGRSFKVLGIYATYEELEEAHPTGQAGDAYAVGTSDDNEVYIWDVDVLGWENIGAIQGPAGPQGPQGPTGPAGADGEDGIGVPEGGTQGQILAKASSTDFDTEWINTPQGGLPEIEDANTIPIAFDFQSYSNDTFGGLVEEINDSTQRTYLESGRVYFMNVDKLFVSAAFSIPASGKFTQRYSKIFWTVADGTHTIEITARTGITINKINEPQLIVTGDIYEIDVMFVNRSTISMVFRKVSE